MYKGLLYNWLKAARRMRKGCVAGFVVALAALASTSCGPRTIGRDELKQIFKDAFLINAYYDINAGSGYRQPVDSLDIYRPVLKRYGYDVADFEHTVNNFARKKSSKLSDVVEQAIGELSDESAMYDGRVAVLDTIDAIAARTLRREVFDRDSIKVGRIADTASLRLNLPVERGTYEISYSYLVDTIDKNRGLRTTFTLKDSTGRRLETQTDYVGLSGERRRPAPRRIVVDTTATQLEVLFGNYPRRDLKAPRIRIDSIRVDYYLPREKALDSVTRRWNKVGIYDGTKDSCALRPLPPRIDTMAVGGDR